MKEYRCKTVFIRTFGCQMNFRDSEFVAGILFENGFGKAVSPEKADVVLFNSCSVRKHAEDRLFSNIADLKDLKKKKPGMVIGLMGCTAQNYKEKILEKAPLVDFVCGPGNETDIPRILKDIIKNHCPIIATNKVNEKRPELFPEYRDSPFKTYVSIGEGCNNFCSYCIVPYVRGRERSRAAKDIVREVKDLAGRGFKEVTLLGQNVNSYRGLAYSVERIAYSKSKNLNAIRYPLNAKKSDFIRLLEELNKIDGIERIRFMTSHPKDASADLFRAMRDLEKVCEHLHLPAQSGSNKILKLMNRGYTSKRYVKLFEEYRKIVPGGSMTTDIMVGFPSETDKDFNDTKRLMEKARFDGAFIFKYSPRPPAKSVRREDDVPEEVKQKRLKTLLDIQCAISLKKNLLMKNRVAQILVDGYNSKTPLLLAGRTRTNKVTIFEGGRGLIGRFVNVRIESVSPHALKGRIVE